MSIIFGTREATARLVEVADLRETSRRTGHMAPDGTYLLTERNLGMGFQPYYTHERSRLEVQPLADNCGNALLWDGRLDNFRELADMFDLPSKTTPDSEIVLAAWRSWGESCFSKFVGEWALVLWSHPDGSLYLARDHAGTRTLYYLSRGESVLWSSALETLVRPSERRELSEEFVARYLCSAPIGTLTPFSAIRAVPPGQFIRVREHSDIIHRSWGAIRRLPLTCKSDAEYEEEFFGLFRQAVKRRTGKGQPALAELSGGMDSSAIVCMSDELRSNSWDARAELIDTISYFDMDEPNWDELPYVSIVEQRRGKAGIHIDMSPTENSFLLDCGGKARSSLWPEDWQAASNPKIAEHSYRVILSGLGGDELLGGVPTPLPELADLLYRHNYVQLLARSIAWCVSDRKALILRLRDVIQFRRSVYRDVRSQPLMIPQWVSQHSREAMAMTTEEEHERASWKNIPPSAVSFLKSWRLMLETLPPPLGGERLRTEYRFPYLDRDLVNFLASVPRDQLVRPGRRRSLMRRALRHIMPTEILERRRKAFVIRRPILAIRSRYIEIRRLFEGSVTAERGYIDRARILAALDEFQTSTSISSHRSISKAISIERWLRDLENID